MIPYQKNWNTLFQVEKEKLQCILRSEIEEIHHIGSTSINGMHAKPIIDILVVVKHIEKMDDYNEPLFEIGYEAQGENGLSGRRFFIKGGDERTHHVHMYQFENKEIARHLVFRDYMRTFKEEGQFYSQLKQNLAMSHPTNMEEYIKGKHGYIQKIEKKAIAWFEEGNNERHI